MRISDWSSDVCSSDLRCRIARQPDGMHLHAVHRAAAGFRRAADLVQWIAEFRLADVAEPLGHLPRRAARRVGLGSLGIVDHLEVPAMARGEEGDVLPQGALGRASRGERWCEYV